MATAPANEIHIVDEMVVKPGLATAFRDLYLERYAPGAVARGMSLGAITRTPAADLAGEPVTVFFHWTVPDSAAWWNARVKDTDAKRDWWNEAATMLVTRRRLTLSGFQPEQSA